MSIRYCPTVLMEFEWVIKRNGIWNERNLHNRQGLLHFTKNYKRNVLLNQAVRFLRDCYCSLKSIGNLIKHGILNKVQSLRYYSGRKLTRASIVFFSNASFHVLKKVSKKKIWNLFAFWNPIMELLWKVLCQQYLDKFEVN